jgi:hypothetical protein
MAFGLLSGKSAFKGMILSFDWGSIYFSLLRKGIRAMIYRVILTLTLIVGVAPFTFAEEVQASPSHSEQQGGVSSTAQVTLDIHWLQIPDGELGAFQNDQMKLPENGAKTILDNKQSHSLLKEVRNNKRTLIILKNTIPLKLPNGKEVKAPDASMLESYKATFSEDRQTIELHLVFQKFKVVKEGVYKVDRERVPEATAVIPIGSSLLIHTRQVSHTPSQTVNLDSGLVGNAVDKLFSIKHIRHNIQTQISEQYLLVTPGNAG